MAPWPESGRGCTVRSGNPRRSGVPRSSLVPTALPPEVTKYTANSRNVLCCFADKLPVIFEDGLGVVDFHPSGDSAIIYLPEADLVSGNSYRRKLVKLHKVNGKKEKKQLKKKERKKKLSGYFENKTKQNKNNKTTARTIQILWCRRRETLSIGLHHIMRFQQDTWVLSLLSPSDP